MKKKEWLLGGLIGLLLSVNCSCEPETKIIPGEIIEIDNTIGVTIHIGSTGCKGEINVSAYELNETVFNVGDTLKAKIKKTADEQTSVRLYWDDKKVKDISEFPYIHEQVLNEKGIHSFKIKDFSENGDTDSVSIEITVM